MRSMLALLAALTLSTSTAVTAVACESTSNQTTSPIFDWQEVINNENGKTASDFFEYLLKNPDLGVGQTLYKDIVDYISLSILKTNPIFDSDYQFAKLTVENQITNIQNSLRAKYGRSWEKQWQNFLKDPAQGGNGNTGSYQRYFDILLKTKANTIVNQYYVGDNYHNYQYYSSTEISIWLNDMWAVVSREGVTIGDYKATGTYKDKVWIVAKSISNSEDMSEAELELQQAIKAATDGASSIKLINQVAKTKDDKELIKNSDGKYPDDYLVDPSNTIKGLLSNQQAKIAQVWMKNQGPIWTRQIVVPFNDELKNRALKTEITVDSFKQQEGTLKSIINDINGPGGFDEALKNQSTDSIKKVTSSTETGDLGLVTLNSNTSNVKASFLYYLYRYVTSAEGVGKNTNTLVPYELNKTTPTSTDLNSLINDINRKRVAQGAQTSTSQYNDLAWMTDGNTTANYSGADGNKVAIFIDTDGIHFIQTPGIAYSSTVSPEPIQDIITEYTKKVSTAGTALTWDDVKPLSDRLGGLTNTPYLDFLQTQSLLWNANNLDSYFDLNESLKNFTSDGTNDIKSNAWWDYILYFNKNIDNIHWNLPSVLNTNVQAPEDKIYDFIKLMKNWFTTTFDTRWNNLQGTNLKTLITNINDLNNAWDSDKEMVENGPPARLNPSDIERYLDQVAGQTIWWYDPNSIQN